MKRLLLVTIDMPRNDVEFSRLFVELFAFEIDSLLYSLLGNQPKLDSPVYSSLGNHFGHL
jgi:hypothetical protein